MCMQDLVRRTSRALLEKSSMYCTANRGRLLLSNNYHIRGASIKFFGYFADLGVIRSTNGFHATYYHGLITKQERQLNQGDNS